MQAILGLTPTELSQALVAAGFPKYRAEQVFRQLYSSQNSFSVMHNLPKDLRQFLQDNFVLEPGITLNTAASSEQDTYKALLGFADQQTVETVLMLYRRQASRNRATCCISTQSGCAMGCSFCATGLGGPGRNLSPAEIVAQARWAWHLAQSLEQPLTNLVYMGMGEPLLNLDNVLKSIEILNHAWGYQIGMRRITISTCGIVPQMAKLAQAQLPLGLAVSLHAATNRVRNQIMPINQKYPLEVLMPACDAYSQATSRRITYEYALIQGVNDRASDAKALGQLLRGRLCNLNIIPVNPVPEIGILPPNGEIIQDFCKITQAYGIEVVIREERGSDIGGACGQLKRQS